MPKKDIGALWVKNNEYGEYMTGSIEINGQKIKLFIGKTRDKKTDRHPDWIIHESKQQGVQQNDINDSIPI